MTESSNERIDAPDLAETLPPDSSGTHGSLSVPPPVPQKAPGFFGRLFMSRQKQQAIAVQNGYLEMVDLIRAIRSHLDRQETVQTRVLTMLEKVPDAMDRQHEVMSLFKKQLDNNIENDRRLTESMGQLSGTLGAMNDTQKASSRTITDLITRSRESEQLLREVMRRAERRMALLIAFFILLVLGMGFYLAYWQNRPQPPIEPAAETVVEPESLPAESAPEPIADPTTEAPVSPEPLPAPAPPETPPLEADDPKILQLKSAIDTAVMDAFSPQEDAPVSLP